MNNLSVIIPSRVESNILACVRAVRAHEPTARIFVIDDGIVPLSAENAEFLNAAVTRLPGIKPFCFSRNMNIGIRAAGDDDVVLLNDDAILETPGGFGLLQKAAAENPEYGLIASTTNNVGNRNQLPGRPGLRMDPRMACFVAVLIPRSTINAVGLLDERFTAYGFDDDDYCLRVRMALLKIGILNECFVDHRSLKSTFRELTRTASERFGSGRDIFVEKWGAHPL